MSDSLNSENAMVSLFLVFWHEVSLTEVMSNKQIMGPIRGNFRVYMKFELLFVINTEIFHLNSRAMSVSWTL